MTKICKICKIEKSIEDFQKVSGGYRNTKCGECLRAYKRERSKHWNNVTVERVKRWKKNNREAYLLQKKRHRENRRTDLKWRIINNLRTRLATIVRITNSKKLKSHIKDLGCTIEELKLHLELQFKPGMTWDNYGNGIDKWNIDHIEPISRLDPNDPKSYERLCHYTNLQPMWQPDNSSKGDKYETT